MEDLQEIINIVTSDREARYFYHVTGIEGSKILEEGLVVANPSWEQSFLEFTEEELENIEIVINDNNKTRLKNNNSIIIARMYPENENDFIRRLSEEEMIGLDFEGVSTPDYIVDTGNILGYIDLNTLEFNANEEIDLLDNYSRF